MHRMGFAYDWNLEITTCEPDYYRWNQWFFLKMMERGLAYRKKALVNWCPECGTVLANEQVVDGCCWRHEDTPVEQRALEQWFWKITDYADELLRDIDEKLEGDWPERVLSMQRNWIGQLGGVGDRLSRSKGQARKIRVFTTRVDTIYGATCVILAPEHPLAQKLLDDAGRAAGQADDRCAGAEGSGRCGKRTARSRALSRSIRTAAQKVPIWIGNFVLMDYGTGAIMAVPAHDERDFEFCKTFGIADRAGDSARGRALDDDPKAAFTGRRHCRKFRRVFRACRARKRARQMNAQRRTRRLRQGRDHVSHQGLGNFAAALLGHADSGDPLPEVRRGSGARERSAGDLAVRREVHGQGALAAGRCRGVHEREVPPVRRGRAARERHHGHVRRFVLVFLSLLRSA